VIRAGGFKVARDQAQSQLGDCACFFEADDDNPQ